MVVTRWRAVGATLVAACLAVLLSTCPVAGASDRVTAQRLDVAFSAQGATVRADRAWTRLSLAGVGAEHAAAGRAAAPATIGKRVSYAHPGVREWYENGPLGLEQGFTVSRAPRGDGALILAISLHGNLRPRLERGAVLLGGQLRYAGLAVTDARGRAVRSWLSVGKGRLLIHVADRGAAYPVVVDPFIQKGPKVTGAGEDVHGVVRREPGAVRRRDDRDRWRPQRQRPRRGGVCVHPQRVRQLDRPEEAGGRQRRRGRRPGRERGHLRRRQYGARRGNRMTTGEPARPGCSPARAARGRSRARSCSPWTSPAPRCRARAWRCRRTAATALIGGYGDSSGEGRGVGVHPLRLDLDAAGGEARRLGRDRRGSSSRAGASRCPANGSTALIGGPGDGSAPGRRLGVHPRRHHVE